MICTAADSPIDTTKLTQQVIDWENEVLHGHDDANGQPIVTGYTVIGNSTVCVGRLATGGRGLTVIESG